MEILLVIQPWMAEGGEEIPTKIIHKIITQVLFTQSFKKYNIIKACPTKMCIKSAPYLHQISAKSALNFMLFFDREKALFCNPSVWEIS